MSELELDLTIDGSAFVESESIPFTVVLRNVGTETATIAGFDPENQSITLVAESSDGTEHLGTQMSWSKRDGDPFHDPREIATIDLEPGASVGLDGDALPWLGVLPAGSYEFYAAYASGTSIYAESARLSVTIEPADVLAFDAAVSPTQPAFEPLLAAWVHDAGAERRLFLLETSANHPPNLFRNRAVSTMREEHVLRPAAVAFEGVPARHLVWAEGGEIHVAAVQREPSPVRTSQIATGYDSISLLKSPLSHEDGSVHVVAFDSAAGLLHFRVGPDGQSSRRRLLARENISDVYALLWGRSETAHLVWKPRNARALAYATFDLSTEGGAVEPRMLELSDGSPEFVILRERFEDEAFRVQASVLMSDVPDRDGLVLLSFEPPTGQMDEKAPLPLPFDGFDRVEDATIDDEDRLVALLAATDGTMYVAQQGGAAAVPLFRPDGQSLRVEARPVLWSTPVSSQRPGTYVGYLPEEGPIQIFKLELDEDGR